MWAYGTDDSFSSVTASALLQRQTFWPGSSQQLLTLQLRSLNGSGVGRGPRNQWQDLPTPIQQHWPGGEAPTCNRTSNVLEGARRRGPKPREAAVPGIMIRAPCCAELGSVTLPKGEGGREAVQPLSIRQALNPRP